MNEVLDDVSFDADGNVREPFPANLLVFLSAGVGEIAQIALQVPERWVEEHIEALVLATIEVSAALSSRKEIKHEQARRHAALVHLKMARGHLSKLIAKHQEQLAALAGHAPTRSKRGVSRRKATRGMNPTA